MKIRYWVWRAWIFLAFWAVKARDKAVEWLKDPR